VLQKTVRGWNISQKAGAVSSNTHGDFTDEQMLNAYSAIREFLLKSNIGPVRGPQ
jgi:hypothetical protein